MTDKDRRKAFANGLSEIYLPYYLALCDNLEDHWQPYSGFRSRQEQDALYAKGRTLPPLGETVTKARGGNSAHNYGCASDWTVFKDGKPLWIDEEDPAWKEYEEACNKVGLLWGGEFKSITDFYHNELKIACTWKQVKAVLDSSGMSAAMDFIAKSEIK